MTKADVQFWMSIIRANAFIHEMKKIPRRVERHRKEKK